MNPQLERAGWNLADRSQVRFEVPVAGYDPTPWNGFTDFSLFDPTGHVIAVIEAKRTARNPRDGEHQLLQYVTEISNGQPFTPFGFMAGATERHRVGGKRADIGTSRTSSICLGVLTEWL